jgi:double-stranded uracil-DNA glycosylase
VPPRGPAAWGDEAARADRAGFTERQLSPAEDHALLGYGYGLTNVVARASAGAAELAAAEYVEGGARLVEKLERFRPRWLAVLGVEAFRKAFAQPRAGVGPQSLVVGGTRVWVLPNPSGLNAHYQLPALAGVYAELRAAVESGSRARAVGPTLPSAGSGVLRERGGGAYLRWGRCRTPTRGPP